MVSLNLSIGSIVTKEMLISVKEEANGIEDSRLKQSMFSYLNSLQRRYDNQVKIDGKKW